MTTDIEAVKARVLASKARLAAAGDPLGIRSGRYAKRPKHGVGDLTPEYRSKVEGVLIRECLTPAGAKTGDMHRLVVSCIDRLASRGAITEDERQAARRYQDFARMDESDLSKAIAIRYQEWRKGDRSALEPAEWLVAQRQAVAEIRARVAYNQRDVLRWIEREGWNDVGLDDLAQMYFPGLSRDRGASQALGLLRSVLWICAEEFGMPNDWRPPKALRARVG